MLYHPYFFQLTGVPGGFLLILLFVIGLFLFMTIGRLQVQGREEEAAPEEMAKTR